MRDDGNIDYSTYTYRELLEALNNINADKYPKNYANLQAALEKIGPVQRLAMDELGEPTEVLVDFDESEQSDPDLQRIQYLLMALTIAIVGIYMLTGHTFSIPANPKILVSLDENGRYLAIASLLFAAAVPLSFVVDYMDKRDNRRYYLLFVIFSGSAAAVLLFLACSIETQLPS